MRFKQPFIKLPIRFDAEALEREVRALPDSSWVPHPTGFVGNEAVRLVTVGGRPTDDFDGPMRPTSDLARCAYVQQIMAELDGVWTRSRFMGLGAGAEVPLHVDSHYHWRTHIRIHIPVITNPKVLFTCGDETIHMAAGECWIFDSFRFHRVENNWNERRIHLVLDTVMTRSLRALIDAGLGDPTAEPRFVAPGSAPRRQLKFEQFNAPIIMSPWEIRCHAAFIFDQAAGHPQVPALRDRINRFADDWGAVWAQFGPTANGIPAYQQLLAECRAEMMQPDNASVMLTNEALLANVLDSLIFGPALTPVPASGNIVASVPRQRLAS
ncbi:MAG TPA: aspartyl/asparaginyl beta-hydroxylase domain-containing protein [Sphingomicrobium sp.]|nr:aspartyl/asparaginyl beta-hydroxylase domain-containing protein [Sphingomicrobium sp.]